MARKNLLFVLKILLSAVAITIIFTRINCRSFAQAFASANPLYLAAGLAFSFLWPALNALKIKLLLPGTPIQFQYILFTNFTATFIRLTLPTELGAELGRGYYFARKTGSATTAFSAIILDRYLGLFSQLAVLGCAAAFFGIFHGNNLWLWIGLAGLAGALCLAGACIFFMHGRGINRSSRKGLVRITAVLHDFAAYVRSFRTMVRRMAAVVALSLVLQCISLITLIIVSAAYHEPLGFHEAASIVFFSIIGFVAPVSVAGLGIVEGIYAAMFKLFSLHTEIGVAVSLSLRVLSIIVAVPGFLFFVYGEKLIKKTDDGGHGFPVSPPSGEDGRSGESGK